jgi:hypothetical protein
LISPTFKSKSIKASDLVDLGRPGKNATYLAFVNETLIASSFGDLHCKKSLEHKWTHCGQISSQGQISTIGSPEVTSFLKKNDQYAQPIFIGSSRYLTTSMEQGFRDCTIAQGQMGCKTIKKDAFCINIYAYDVYSNIVSLYCSNGDKYTYDLKLNQVELITPAQSLGISNQFYTTYVHGDRVLIGHYPSGGFLEKTEFGESFLTPPPIKEFRNPNARELQSIGFVGGKILAGIWPWGSVWEANVINSGISFNSSFRLFSPSHSLKDAEHPYENKLSENYARNELGQRISSIIPCWNGLCISTSSKNRLIHDEDLEEDLLSQYGKVYYLAGPKATCSAKLDTGKYFSLTVENDLVEIIKDGITICKFKFSNSDLQHLIEKVSSIKVGSNFAHSNGHSGQMHTFKKLTIR